MVGAGNEEMKKTGLYPQEFMVKETDTLFTRGGVNALGVQRERSHCLHWEPQGGLQ